MQARKIGDGVWWVGAIDWDGAFFDSLIPLPDGTSYNAYFVQGTEKNALIDAVDPAMKKVLFERLQSLNITAIDYVIANHAEQDHSGTIPDILAAYPMAKVLSSDKCKPLLMDLLAVPEDRIMIVKDGEKLDLGEKTLAVPLFSLGPLARNNADVGCPEQKTLFTCDLVRLAPRRI